MLALNWVCCSDPTIKLKWLEEDDEEEKRKSTLVSDSPRPAPHLYRRHVSGASDRSDGHLTLLKLSKYVVGAGDDVHIAADVGGQSEVGILPDVDDLLKHAFQGRLITRHSRDVLNLVFVLRQLRAEIMLELTATHVEGRHVLMPILGDLVSLQINLLCCTSSTCPDESS